MSPKPMKMKSYESFDDWKSDLSITNQSLIDSLQSIVETTAPELDTSVKWGQGCWLDGDKPKVFIHTEEDHVQLGFYYGSTLIDPEKLLTGKGKFVRAIKIYNADQINPESYMKLIKQAMK